MQPLKNTTEEFKEQLHILVIDDDEVDQMTIKRSLGKSNLNATVDTATTAHDALLLLQDQVYDCIFLDFMLPDMNGLDLLQKIQSMGVQAPLLVVTSQGDEQIAARAIRLGAADYISKGFLTPDGVHHSVRNAIRIKKAEIQQRLTADHLQSKQSQLNLLLSNLPMSVWNVSSEGIITFISGKILEMLKLDAAKITGQNFKEAFEGFPGIIDRIKRALAGETVQAVDKHSGNYFRSVNVPALDETGAVIGLNGFAFDITESMQKERELIYAKELAEQSVRVKEQFIANISHEIRTPMNGIIGLTKVLQKTQLDQEQKKYLKAIQTSADNLMIIINDLLDFSKITSQSFSLEHVAFDLSEMLTDLHLLMKARVEERGNELSIKLDDGIPQRIQGDPLRIRQILLNLVGNAAKFTENGQVKLTASLVEDLEHSVLVEFMVEDTGIGIPEDKLEAIFESFNQGSNDTTRKYGGTGLGLTISKNLVELQGGTITVRSKPMVGSSFSFTLPFGKIMEEKNIVPEAAKVETEQAQETLPLHVLLAEDNEINQLLITKVLGDWGMKITAVENGKLALEELARQTFDIILMDMQMPVMDGYEAIGRIRSMNGAVAALPIVSLTAHAAASEIDKCFAAGANAYVSKPFDPKELYQTIQRLTATT